MIKFLVKLDKDMESIEVSAYKGKEVLYAEKDKYKKDLSDKIIHGLEKNLSRVKIKKGEQIRCYLDFESKSFVTNLIGNSVIGIFNWLQKKD